MSTSFISVQVATLPPNNYSSFLDKDGCAVSSFIYAAHFHRRAGFHTGALDGPKCAYAAAGLQAKNSKHMKDIISQSAFLGQLLLFDFTYFYY